MEKSIYSAEYQRLCALLRTLREEAGLTQVEVATRLDEPQSFVSKYESGERRLDVIELYHVATAIGVPAEVAMRVVGCLANLRHSRILSTPRPGQQVCVCEKNEI